MFIVSYQNSPLNAVKYYQIVRNIVNLLIFENNVMQPAIAL